MCSTNDSNAENATHGQCGAHNQRPSSITRVAMESIESEFENFFNECRKQCLTAAQMSTICQPLLWQSRPGKSRCFWTTVAVMGALLLLLFVMYQWSTGFAWLVSSLGRLALLQLLPYWDWTPLYTAKCLIDRPRASVTTQPTTQLSSSYREDVANCVLCETLEHIPIASNASFSQLETVYLERGLPVVVTDSHQPVAPLDFVASMQQAPGFVEHAPCDVATNLMLRQLFNVDLALEKTKVLDKWFLQLRSCRFKAVKASRVFVSRPYYYPVHLEPFYSSWVLMSHNYAVREKDIYLQGLVIVQQLHGQLEVRLRPTPACRESCPSVNIRLSEGEALVFSTDLWSFSYGTEGVIGKVTSIATILEIDWQL